eukprot:scaffold25279_cov72-Skeletonema_dohrnii-CCMP3373.AAC.1
MGSAGGIKSSGGGGGMVDPGLVDFQDRVILIATQIACDGNQDVGSLLVEKACADKAGKRVVEAYYRQNKSAEQTIEVLKSLYMSGGGGMGQGSMGQMGGGMGGMGQGSIGGGMGQMGGGMGGGGW